MRKILFPLCLEAKLVCRFGGKGKIHPATCALAEALIGSLSFIKPFILTHHL